MLDSMRGDRGQGTVEYVAVVALVAIVFAAASALTSGGLGVAVARAVKQGVCEVAAESCPALHAASIPADLEACPLKRDGKGQSASVDIGVVRLAGQMGIAVETLSSGKVRISFADSGRAGVGAAVGAHVTIGGRSARGEASVDAGIAVTSGRVWTLPSSAAAERFIAKYAQSETFGGRARASIGKICPLCAALAGAPAEPPAADERWISGGLAVGSKLGLGEGPVSGQLESTLRGAIGRRTSRSGTTWFLRLDDTVAAKLDALGGGLDGQADGSSLASLQLAADGTPIRLKLTVGRAISSRQGLRLPSNLRALLGSSRSGSGQLIESDTVLDLSDPSDRRAAVDLLASAHGGHVRSALAAVTQLRRALDLRGARTVRRFDSKRAATGLGAGGALGIRLGLDTESNSSGDRLVSVATKLPGLNWLPRADCLAV